MSHGVAKRAYAHTHGWALIQGHYCPSTESKTDTWDFPGGPVVKNPPANAGDWGLISGLGRLHMSCAPQRVVPLLSKSNSPTEQKIQRKDPSCQQTQVSKGRGKTPAWSRSSFSWLMTSLVRWEPFPFTNLSTRGHMSEVPLATLFLTKNLGLKVTTFFQRPCRDDLFPS